MNAIHKGDVTHWTVPALNELIELNAQGKLENLTPHQARDLAVDIAARNHLSADAEHNMQQAFAATAKITSTAQNVKDKINAKLDDVKHDLHHDDVRQVH